MIELNTKDMSIEIKEILSFDGYVKPIIDDIIQEVKANVESYPEDYEEELEEINGFLNYKMTNEDKIDILKEIMNNYEWHWHSVRIDSEDIIFDKTNIRNILLDWIEDNFQFSVC